MLDFLKRKNRPSQPPQMTPVQGQRAATNLHELIMSAGCLAANIAGMGQDLSIRIAEGDISEASLAELLNTMHNANDDMERACKRVSQGRTSLAPARTAMGEADHD